MSKTNAEVDAIMFSIHWQYRYRWCGGEAGPCACLGCVQICSRELMYKKQFGHKCRIDPEHLDPYRFPANIRESCTITKAEWEAWVLRHPQRDEDKPKYTYEVRE